jgi:segregation and condensation protein B
MNEPIDPFTPFDHESAEGTDLSAAEAPAEPETMSALADASGYQDLAPDETPVEPEGSDDWSGDDIEQAYRKALAALEDVPWEPESIPVPESEGEPQPAAATTPDPQSDADAGSSSEPAASPLEPAASGTQTPPGPRLASGTERPRESGSDGPTSVSPQQVIEAVLVVGGGPVTARKFCSILRGSADAAAVERSIDDLNDQYVAEGRPYEIRLGDGGYRLELRPEYEKLRHRVYGSGPREVRLSQDILEVLALVAYQQPISQQEIESHGKQNTGGLLRQLLRRDLVTLQRGAGGRKDVKYATTPRFLTVFGLGNLDELPQPDDLARK